jgi:hypothetical protein
MRAGGRRWPGPPQPGLGVGVIVQCPAESFMAKVDWVLAPVLARPTAMQDWVLVQEMPLSVLLLAALGLETTAQFVPFQLSARIWSRCLCPARPPTAMQAVLLVHETLARKECGWLAALAGASAARPAASATAASAGPATLAARSPFLIR